MCAGIYIYSASHNEHGLMPGSWHVMLFIMIFNLWLSQVAGTPHNANLKAIENGYGICVYIYIYIYCARNRVIWAC